MGVIHLGVYAEPNSRATCSLEPGYEEGRLVQAVGVVFHRTVQDINAAAATELDEVQRIVDEAVGEVRADRRAKGRLGEGCTWHIR